MNEVNTKVVWPAAVLHFVITFLTRPQALGSSLVANQPTVRTATNVRGSEYHRKVLSPK